MDSLIQAIIITTWSPDVYNKHLGGKLPNDLLKPYSSAILQMSEEYLHESSGQLRPFGIQEAIAYSLYYLPINYFKVQNILSRLPDLASNEVTILDFGTGPATAPLALIDLFPDKNFYFSLVEHSESMKQQAVKLLEYYKSIGKNNFNYQFTTEKEFELNNYDIIFACNSINELSEASRSAWINNYSKVLNQNGTLVIIEPALQESSRKLMKLRNDFFREQAEFQILFPCFHSKPCPMYIDNQKDWCHGELNWDTPQLVQQIDQLTGFNKHRLKYSALVISKTGSAEYPSYSRVVDFQHTSKSGTKIKLCSTEGLKEVVLSKKEIKKLGIKRLRLHDMIQ